MLGRETLSSIQAAAGEAHTAAAQTQELTGLATGLLNMHSRNLASLETDARDTLDAWRTAGQCVSIAVIVIAASFAVMAGVAIVTRVRDYS